MYYLDIALLAHELGAKVMVVNPRTAHHFAQVLNRRNKTDKLDAAMLLECLQRMLFQTWEAPCKLCLDLRSCGHFLG